MRIVAFSDSHGFHTDLRLPLAEVLIVAGDFTKTGTLEEIAKFAKWLEKQPHDNKVVIAGNHEIEAEHNEQIVQKIFTSSGVFWLRDTSVNIQGYHFWGSPWVGDYRGAYNRPTQEILPRWKSIPNNIDVLVTHAPPTGIGDTNHRGISCGDPGLLQRIDTLEPKIHIYGHIHESHGIRERKNTVHANVAVCGHKDVKNAINKATLLEII